MLTSFHPSLTPCHVSLIPRNLPSLACLFLQIMHLERTRGDGGSDYFSMDRGSAFASCY
jgi:hypothetical protein